VIPSNPVSGTDPLFRGRLGRRFQNLDSEWNCRIPISNVTPSPLVPSQKRHAVHLNREKLPTTQPRVPKGSTLSPTAGRKPAASVGFAWGANLRPTLRHQRGQGFHVRTSLEEVDFEETFDAAPGSVQPVVMMNDEGERDLA
jgi:hypothetical protein